MILLHTMCISILKEIKNEVICVRNDKISIKAIEEMNPDIIFISPGPGNPSSAGICLEVVKYFGGKISIFGICFRTSSNWRSVWWKDNTRKGTLSWKNVYDFYKFKWSI